MLGIGAGILFARVCCVQTHCACAFQVLVSVHTHCGHSADASKHTRLTHVALCCAVPRCATLRQWSLVDVPHCVSLALSITEPQADSAQGCVTHSKVGLCGRGCVWTLDSWWSRTDMPCTACTSPWGAFWGRCVCAPCSNACGRRGANRAIASAFPPRPHIGAESEQYRAHGFNQSYARRCILP